MRHYVRGATKNQNRKLIPGFSGFSFITSGFANVFPSKSALEEEKRGLEIEKLLLLLFRVEVESKNDSLTMLSFTKLYKTRLNRSLRKYRKVFYGFWNR